MRKLSIGVLLALSVALVLAVTVTFTGRSVAAHDDDAARGFRARLTGFQEVPSRLTTGRGRFQAHINEGDSAISYELRYRDLTAPATEAHIHFAQRKVNGGIIAYLCGGPKPPCPPTGGTITGTITAADIVGPADQGIAPGDLAGALRAMRAGFTYVNVHSARFPAGEIRGQIKAREGAGNQAGDDQDDHGHDEEDGED